MIQNISRVNCLCGGTPGGLRSGPARADVAKQVLHQDACFHVRASHTTDSDKDLCYLHEVLRKSRTSVSCHRHCQGLSALQEVYSSLESLLR